MKTVIDISDEKWVRALDGTWCGSAEIPKGIPLENVLEDIKAEIKQGISHFANENGDISYGLNIAEDIIDKHISGGT